MKRPRSEKSLPRHVPTHFELLAQPLVFLPSPAEIKKATAKIRKTWFKSGGRFSHGDPVEPPVEIKVCAAPFSNFD